MLKILKILKKKIKSRMTNQMVEEIIIFLLRMTQFEKKRFFYFFLKILKFWDPMGPLRPPGGTMSP